MQITVYIGFMSIIDYTSRSTEGLQPSARTAQAVALSPVPIHRATASPGKLFHSCVQMLAPPAGPVLQVAGSRPHPPDWPGAHGNNRHDWPVGFWWILHDQDPAIHADFKFSRASPGCRIAIWIGDAQDVSLRRKVQGPRSKVQGPGSRVQGHDAAA